MFNQQTLKNNFDDIKYLRESVLNLLESLKEKIGVLNIIYKELLTTNKSETYTGLDAFHFQRKLINIELESKYSTFKIIDNRIYCDYYKLYKNSHKYLLEVIKNKNVISIFDNKKYPVYKDLDESLNYDFETTIEIHNDIIQILELLSSELHAREHKLKLQKIKQEAGLNVDNLVNNVEYNNKSLENHIALYSNELKTFNNFHQKDLTRFSLRTKLLYGQVNSDIKLEESKNNISIAKDTSDNVVLDNNEERLIRNCINHDSYSDKIQDSTRSNIENELNCMLSNVSLTPPPLNDAPIIRINRDSINKADTRKNLKILVNEIEDMRESTGAPDISNNNLENINKNESEIIIFDEKLNNEINEKDENTKTKNFLLKEPLDYNSDNELEYGPKCLIQ